MEVKVSLATKRNLRVVKELADEHRFELGFVRLAALEEAIKERRVFVALNDNHIVGFAHFRCCKDGHATIYEIAVAPEQRGKGVGKALVNAVVEEAKRQGCKTLRLKCPTNLPPLDTIPIIYFMKAHEQYDALVTAIFQRINDGQIVGVTSVITVTEVFRYPKTTVGTSKERNT